jgi:hypothetical protein
MQMTIRASLSVTEIPPQTFLNAAPVQVNLFKPDGAGKPDLAHNDIYGVAEIEIYH